MEDDKWRLIGVNHTCLGTNWWKAHEPIWWRDSLGTHLGDGRLKHYITKVVEKKVKKHLVKLGTSSRTFA